MSSKVILPLLALAVALGAETSRQELPREFLPELARVETAASRAAAFRRLVAETDGLPRLAAPVDGHAPVVFDHSSRSLIFDLEDARKASEWDFQLALARELARASLDLPIELVEGELAALQREMEFALEYARVDVKFSKELKTKVESAAQRAQALRTLETWARSKLGPEFNPEPLERLPTGELDRLAVLMALMAQGHERLYAAAQRLLPWSQEAVLLTEVEDVLDRHGPQVADALPRLDEAYVRLSGRRYPSAVVRAAKTVQPLGGAKRLGEALGAMEIEAPELSRRIQRWLRRGD